MVNGGAGISFSRERRYKRSVRTALDRCFSEVRLIRGVVKVSDGTRLWELGG